MITDFSATTETAFEADLCIVGTGVAAYTMLSVLSASSLKIVVLERGGVDRDSDESKEKECHITGHRFTGHQDGRCFGLGGTSLTWGGQALPLHDFDLEAKDWVAHSGWPLTQEDIEPYIPAAEAIFNVDPVPYNTDVFSLRSLPPLSPLSGQVEFHFSKWSPSPNFKPGWLNTYAPHPRISILTHARATSMEYDDLRREVDQINIHDPQGKTGVVKAKRYVLAAGGLENPLLLLASETMPSNPWIGKMFQDHPTAQVATVRPYDKQILQRYFGYFFRGKTRMLPRISLTRNAVYQNRILSATSFIQFIPPEGSFYESLKEIYRPLARGHKPTGKVIRNALRSMTQIGSIFKVLKAFVVDRYSFVPNGTPRLTVMIEQSPNVKSKIVLSDKMDHTGHRIPEIQWFFGEDTIATFKTFCLILDSEFKKLNIGKIEWDAWTKEDPETIRHHFIDAYHHMGGTRMSKTPETGVVNSDSRMHDVSNVYVAGSSVFPTSGHSNPTLTFMALAIRLSHHLTSLN